MAHIDQALADTKDFYKRMDFLAEHLTELMLESPQIQNEATEYAYKCLKLPQDHSVLTDDLQDLICSHQWDYYRMLASKMIANLCQVSNPEGTH